MVQSKKLKLSTIGERVRARREKLKLTQRELARRAGRDFITVWRIEHDRILQPQLETLTSLAVALEVPLGWLVLGQRAA